MPRHKIREVLDRLGVPSMADPPFACPPDVILDLPPPPSVNRTRKVHWRGEKKHKAWIENADAITMAAKCKTRGFLTDYKITGPFEAIITISESETSIDLDNGIKAIIDYARRIELIVDDGQQFLRKLTVQWGDAPMGCRLVLRGMGS